MNLSIDQCVIDCIIKLNIPRGSLSFSWPVYNLHSFKLSLICHTHVRTNKSSTVLWEFASVHPRKYV